MANFRVFQYMVFHQEPAKKDAVETKPTIIKDVTTIVEKSEELVKMKAVRELTDEWAEKLENVVIVVRAF